MKYKFLLLMLLAFFTVKAQIVKQPVPDKTVVLTFDDAVVSQYNIVAPLLKKYHFGATFFICEFPPNFADTTKYMSWQMIQKLNEQGFEIANHTQTHPAVAKLPKDELQKELTYIENKCVSNDISFPVTFAYPGYSLSKNVIDVLLEKGYVFARAGGSRVYDPETDYPMLLPSWAMSDENRPEIMEALKQARDGKIVILTIHGVPDVEHPWVTTSPELFREYAEYLHQNKYNVVALRDLDKYIDVQKALTELKPDFAKALKN